MIAPHKFIVYVKTGSGYGTGFYSGGRFLFTSLHIVQNEDIVQIFLIKKDGVPDNHQLNARVIYRMPAFDVALMEVLSGDMSMLEPANIAPFPDLEGHYFKALGFPEAAGSLLTEIGGIVRIRRPVNYNVTLIPSFQLEPSNAYLIPSGLSGSPVFSSSVGGIIAIYAGDYPNTGVHFAIPIIDVLTELPLDVRKQLDIKLLPQFMDTGYAKSYSPDTFFSILDPTPWRETLLLNEQSVVILTGPSGVGKSSHASAWAQEARARGDIVVWGNITGTLGFAYRRILSGLDYLFELLSSDLHSPSHVSQAKFLSQLSLAMDAYRKIMETEGPRLIIFADAVEKLIDYQEFWKRVCFDLNLLDRYKIRATFVCCQRSEFAESDPYFDTQGIKSTVLTLALLTKEQAVDVYESGYRSKKYPWLPPAEELPGDLLDLCRLPLLMHFIVTVIGEMKSGVKAKPAVIIRKIISEIIMTASNEILDITKNTVITRAVQTLLKNCIGATVSRMAFSKPPRSFLRTDEILAIITENISALQLGAAILSPFDILSALSKGGLIELQDEVVTIGTDILYEFLVCELYCSQALSSGKNDETIAQNILAAINSAESENVVPDKIDVFVTHLLVLPPCREIFALRFLGTIVTDQPDWALIELGLDLKLLQVVRNYCFNESSEEQKLDEQFYIEVLNKMPNSLAEGILAYPPHKQQGVQESGNAFGFTDSLNVYEFPRADEWVIMRRALFLLFILSEHRLTVLQNIAAFFNANDPNYASPRLAFVAKAILQKNPLRAIQACALGQSDAITNLLIHIKHYEENLHKDGNDQEYWPDWLSWIAEKLIVPIMATFEIEDERVKSGPLFFFVTALKAEPEKVVKLVGNVLKSGDADLRIRCLKLCEVVVDLGLHIQRQHIAKLEVETEIPMKLFSNYSSLLRKELSVHSRRPHIEESERLQSTKILEELWDGSSRMDDLPIDADLRFYAIEHTIHVNIDYLKKSVSEVAKFFREKISTSNDAIQNALDGIVFCLTITSRYPSEWKNAWNAMSDFIVSIPAIKEMSDVLQIVTAETENEPGARFEALNALIIPLDEEDLFPTSVRAKVLLVERWAKAQYRYPSEQQIYSLLEETRELLSRKDFIAAIKCAKTLLDVQGAFFMKAQGLLYLAHAYNGAEDYESVVETIGRLERFAKSNLQGAFDFIIDESALNKYLIKVRNSQRNHVLTLLWAARELRASVYQKQNRIENAMTDLSSNRQEAIEIKAWWHAFRGLERECELYVESGIPEKAMKVCEDLIAVSDDTVPQLFGKMQRAIILHQRSGRNDPRGTSEALSIINELLPQLTLLKGKIPDREIEGIFLWLESTRSWCLRDLARHEEAISNSHTVLAEARRIQSQKDIANALGMLKQCQESAGKIGDALMTAEEKYNYCRDNDHLPPSYAADAALDVAHLFSQIARDTSTIEAAKLALHWFENSQKRYQEIGDDKMINEITVEIKSLQELLSL